MMFVDWRTSIVIGGIYLMTYFVAFFVTSIYCGYIVICNDNQNIKISNPVIQWLLLTWNKKRLYLCIIPHLFDQATDIAVIIEYYQLRNDINISNKIDTIYLFWGSIIIIIVSRIISAIAVSKMTHNCCDFILGILDLTMFKAIYVGYILDRKSPTNIQRYIGLLEATLESFPQLILSTLYVTTTVAYETESISVLIIISLLSSLYALTARVASDDKHIYNTNWKGIRCNLCTFPCINLRYILRVLMRFMEISSRLILYVLLWVNLGGFYTSIILGIELIYLVCIVFRSGSIEALGNMMYFVIVGNVNEKTDFKLILIFLVYRFISAYIYLTLITILSNFENIGGPKIPNFYNRHRETMDSQFGFTLLIYCWISHFIWPYIGSFIAYHYARRNKTDTGIENRSRTRDIESLIYVNDINGFIDIITFGAHINHDIYWYLYISLMNQRHYDGSFIFNNNARYKADQICNLQANKEFKINKRFECFKWDDYTQLGGLIRIKTKRSIHIGIDSGIYANECGYYGNNQYNTNGHDSQNPGLFGYLYHGSGGMNIKHAGGGTIVLISESTIVNDGEINACSTKGNGGTIFICCKIFINRENGFIEANSVGGTNGQIAIYTNSYDNYNNDGMKPEPFIGTYHQGLEIIRERQIIQSINNDKETVILLA